MDRANTTKTSSFDFFQWLSPAAQIAFKAASHRRRYAHGQTIYLEGEEGDEMFRVDSGSVRLSVSWDDGREVLFILVEPGDCFGVSSLADCGPRPQTAEAQGQVELSVLNRPAFDRLRMEWREFDAALLRVLSRQMRLVSGYLVDAHLAQLSARVAARIVEAANSFGVSTDGGIRLAINLPQSELASMVGASRQRVNQVLQKFRAQGLISVEYRSLIVLDIETLTRRASHN